MKRCTVSTLKIVGTSNFFFGVIDLEILKTSRARFKVNYKKALPDKMYLP